MYHTATGARVNDVSRHAESIGEPPSLWEGLYVVHPEVGLLGALFKPQFCLCVCVDGRPADRVTPVTLLGSLAHLGNLRFADRPSVTQKYGRLTC